MSNRYPCPTKKGPGRRHKEGKAGPSGKPVGYIKHNGPLVPAPAHMTFGHRNGG